MCCRLLLRSQAMRVQLLLLRCVLWWRGCQRVCMVVITMLLLMLMRCLVRKQAGCAVRDRRNPPVWTWGLQLQLQLLRVGVEVEVEGVIPMLLRLLQRQLGRENSRLGGAVAEAVAEGCRGHLVMES